MVLARFAETLAVLGDETRLRLCALLRDRELRVRDLVTITGISQSRTSTHLGRLKEAGYVQDRRQGNQSFYALTPDKLSAGCRQMLDELLTIDDPLLQSDQHRAAQLEQQRRADAGDDLGDDIERDYSPGRSWQSLALGLAAGLNLGRVLDIGCGDGSAAACIAPYCKQLCCVDTDSGLVKQAQARLKRFTHANAQLADAQQLPFDDQSFDTALLFHTLTYASSPAALLKQTARVLRPKGRLLLLCLNRHDHQQVTQRYRERHPGFHPEQVRQLLVDASFTVLQAEVACRENRKPHLEVVLAVGQSV